MRYTTEQLKHIGVFDANGKAVPIKWGGDGDEWNGDTPMIEYRITRIFDGRWRVGAGLEFLCYRETLDAAKWACEKDWALEVRRMSKPTLLDTLLNWI